VTRYDDSVASLPLPTSRTTEKVLRPRRPKVENRPAPLHFAAIGEHFLIRNDVSVEATGLLARILIYPDGSRWGSTADLATAINVPEDVVRGIVKELMEYGLIIEVPCRTGDTTWETDLSVHGRAWRV